MPAGKTKKNENYLRDSLKLAEQIKALEEKTSLAVREHLSNFALVAGEKLTQLVTHGDETISLQASKHVLKLIGLEKERHEVGGTDGQPITLVVKRYREGDQRAS